MTREEAIANLNMISVAFVEPVTKEQRKLIDDTFDMAIKALEQEPSGDLISRQAVIDVIKSMSNANPSYWNKCDVVDREDLIDEISELPSVKQEPKTGHWINDEDTIGCYYCSECGGYVASYDDAYCKYCGARMVEPQESEDKE